MMCGLGNGEYRIYCKRIRYRWPTVCPDGAATDTEQKKNKSLGENLQDRDLQLKSCDE